MGNRQRQGAIGPRLDEQRPVGGGQGGVHVYVHCRYPRLGRFLAPDVAPHLHVVVVRAEGFQEIGAEYQQVVGIAVVVGIVGAVTVGGLLGCLRTGGADRGVADGTVGRAIELAEGAQQSGAGGAPAAAVEVGKAMRLVLVTQGVQATGHGLVGFVPTDWHELWILIATLVGVGALHRTLETIRVIQCVGAQVPLGAELAVGDGVIGAAINAMHFAVGGVNVNAAARRALGTDALGYDRGRRRFGCRVRFGQGREAIQLARSQTDRTHCPGRCSGLQEAAPGRLWFQKIHGTAPCC